MKNIFVFTIVNLLFVNVHSYYNILSRMFSKKNDLPSSKLIKYPKLNHHELTLQDKYDLQWYVIGETKSFLTNVPKKIKVWNTNYVVWKNENNTFIGLDDVCPHKGASLSGGVVCNNHVVCPYHGYEFNTDGILSKVPGINFQPSPVYDIDKYNVVEKNGWVYLNTLKVNPKNDDCTCSEPCDIHKENIFVEPEIAQNCSSVFLEMEYNCYSRVLSENSLDVMHIAFVHTFGNAERPNPIREEPPKLVGPNHYKSTYYYEAGEESMARKVFNVKDLIIENEFVLPHTTIARVIFGDQISTVVTFALPIGENKSKLFVKTYRNFWQNQFGDIITQNTMYNTMLQDKVVVEGIDSRFMEGKFNMKFDKLQNTYKSFYKKFIHNYSENSDNK